MKQVPEPCRNHVEFPEGPVSVLEKARRERLNREMAGYKALLNIFEIQIKLYLNQEMKTFKVPMESQDLPQGWFLSSITTTNASFKLAYFLFFGLYFSILKCLPLAEHWCYQEVSTSHQPSAGGVSSLQLPWHTPNTQKTYKYILQHVYGSKKP